jgi:hypothetical protein
LRRLPRFTPVDERLGELSLDERVVLPGHLFGVVVVSSKLDAKGLVAVLRDTLAAEGVDATVVPTPTTGDEVDRERLATQLRERAPCITVGALGAALFRPRISIAFTGGLPPSAWSQAARALRSAFNLELSEARRGVFAELASRLSINACPDAC